MSPTVQRRILQRDFGLLLDYCYNFCNLCRYLNFRLTKGKPCAVAAITDNFSEPRRKDQPHQTTPPRGFFFSGPNPQKFDISASVRVADRRFQKYFIPRIFYMASISRDIGVSRSRPSALDPFGAPPSGCLSPCRLGQQATVEARWRSQRALTSVTKPTALSHGGRDFLGDVGKGAEEQGAAPPLQLEAPHHEEVG